MATTKGDKMSSRKSVSREIRKVLYGSASLLAGLTLTGVAAAQEQAAQDDVLGEVVVKGYRMSLQQSLETKRAAVGVVDAITAEDIGKFPDKNLAEALQRVPGVVVNREFGEGERVNLRGTAANLTRTLINGHALATADWFILDQLNTTRSFNYLMLPSEIIGQVKVYKSPSADLEEGGIGGVIDVETRSPLNLPADTLALSGGVAYTETSDDTDPQASGMYSWRDDDGRFGFLLAGIYQERNIRRDGVEVLGYEDRDPGDATLLVPSLIGSALFQQERIRTGANMGIEFRPSDQTHINLTGLYSLFEADNTNQNYLAWGSRALGGEAGNAACPPTGTLTNTTIVGDTAVAGTISSSLGGTCGFGVVYDSIDRFATAETRNIDLDVSHDLNETVNLHFVVGYTDADGNTDAQPFVEFGAPAVFSYDLRGTSPQVTFQPNAMGVTIDPTNPASTPFIFSSLHQILNNDKEVYAYIDAEHEMDRGIFKSLKYGIKNTDHDRKLTFNATTYGGFHVPINATPSSDFAGGDMPSDFLENISSSGTLRNYWNVNFDAVESILFPNLAGAGRVIYPAQSFSVGEEAWAGYVMGNFEGDRWRGNLGVRYVRTEQESAGAQNRADGEVNNPFGRFTPIRVERDYDDVLPSLNIAFDLTDDLVLRGAAARVMARPDFTDVAPRSSLNLGALTGTSGNPNLDPYRANQADVSLEWYPQEGSILALALYYKDIKSFITDVPVTRNEVVQTATPPAACTNVGTNLWSCPFVINERSNGGGGKIQGVEASAVYPIWGGFGVQGNYTYSDAEADNGDPIPGNSQDTLNLAAYFENQRFSARLAYTYRSEFFVTFDRSTRLNQSDLASLDASVGVNFTDGLSLTLDAVNLTNEKIEQFAEEEFRPRAIYDNGRYFFVNLRAQF